MVHKLRITYRDGTSQAVEFPTQHGATRAYNLIKKVLQKNPDAEVAEVQLKNKPMLIHLHNYFTLSIDADRDDMAEAQEVDSGRSPDNAKDL